MYFTWYYPAPKLTKNKFSCQTYSFVVVRTFRIFASSLYLLKRQVKWYKIIYFLLTHNFRNSVCMTEPLSVCMCVYEAVVILSLYAFCYAALCISFAQTLYIRLKYISSTAIATIVTRWVVKIWKIFRFFRSFFFF